MVVDALRRAVKGEDGGDAQRMRDRRRVLH
jgi:hypothetical protein